MHEAIQHLWSFLTSQGTVNALTVLTVTCAGVKSIYKSATARSTSTSSHPRRQRSHKKAQYIDSIKYVRLVPSPLLCDLISAF